MILISIIIPHFNRSALLKRTIDSVLAQTYRDWEIIVVDDGSDKFEFEKIKEYENNQNISIIQRVLGIKGPSSCRNLGAKMAKGGYLLFLDSDDLLAPFCLAQRASVMLENEKLDFAVFNQFKCLPGMKEPFEVFNKSVKTRDEAIAYFLKMDAAWQTMAPIWKAKTILSLGGFDESLYAMEDPDLHLRALLNSDLDVQICFDLPADCYYFIPEKSVEKIFNFWNDSIKARFQFIKKTVKYLPFLVTPQKLKTYKHFIRDGYFNFIKVFLLSRLKEHSNQFNETNLLLKRTGILFANDILLMKITRWVFTSDSLVLKKLRLRGVVLRLL